MACRKHNYKGNKPCRVWPCCYYANAWDTSDLTNENYWNTPIKSWSKAKTIHFENRNDSIMFKLLWS